MLFRSQFPTVPAGQRFSSSLDTLLLWTARDRRPDATFVHSKYPDEAYHGGDASLLKPPMSLAWYRLNMAAACMGNGFVGKNIGRGPSDLVKYPGRRELRQRFGGFAPPPEYDEYHAGDRNVRGWLGQPVGEPMRLTAHLGDPVWQLDASTPLPAVESSHRDYRAAVPVCVGEGAVKLVVEEAGLWRSERDFFKLKAVFPLGGRDLVATGEYGLRLTAAGDGPFATMERRCRAIPRNVAVRLVVHDGEGKRIPGPYQEFLVFTDPREVALTLTASAAGAGTLEFCIGEAPGSVDLRGIELRPGCADVMWRPFENEVLLLNGSVCTAGEFPMDLLLPGQHLQRLKGVQDPNHNTGDAVGTSVTIAPLDGLFLLREKGDK